MSKERKKRNESKKEIQLVKTLFQECYIFFTFLSLIRGLPSTEASIPLALPTRRPWSYTFHIRSTLSVLEYVGEEKGNGTIHPDSTADFFCNELNFFF